MIGNFYKVIKATGVYKQYEGKIGIFINYVDLEGEGITLLRFGDTHGVFEDEESELEEIKDLDSIFNENAQLAIKEYQNALVEGEKKLDALMEERNRIMGQLSVYAKKLK